MGLILSDEWKVTWIRLEVRVSSSVVGRGVWAGMRGFNYWKGRTSWESVGWTGFELGREGCTGWGNCCLDRVWAGAIGS